LLGDGDIGEGKEWKEKGVLGEEGFEWVGRLTTQGSPGEDHPSLHHWRPSPS